MATEKRNANASTLAQTERAKRAELQLIEMIYESGAQKLERAKEDAMKNMGDMEEAAANRLV